MQIQDFLTKLFTHKYSTYIIAVILLVVGIIIYSNTLHCPFTLDDFDIFVRNPRTTDYATLAKFNMPRYIGIITFVMNYKINAFTLPGYHVVNILIHIINSLLVYLLAQALLTFVHGPEIEKYRHEIPLIIALLFLVHPVQTQAVTYIVQRLTSLAATFALLSIYFYIKFRAITPRRYIFFIISLLSCLLAYKTKENTATLPLILCMVEFILLKQPNNLKSRIMHLLPYFILIIIIPLSFLHLDKPKTNIVEELAAVSYETLKISRTQYFFTELKVIATYLRLMLLPVHQSIDYYYPLSESLFEITTFLALCVSLFLIIIAFTFIKKYPLISFGILWFYIFLAVESSIIPIQDVIFEHRLYLPSIGFIIAFIGLLAFLSEKIPWKSAIPILIAIIIIALAVSTYVRNQTWKDEITLWSDAVQKFPQKQRCYASLGIAYHKKQDYSHAIEIYQKALTMNSRDRKTHHNLGIAYLSARRLDDAIKELSLAIQIDPHYTQAYFGLASIYMEKRDINTAYHTLVKAREFDTGHSWVNALLADIYCQAGNMQEAILLFNEAVKQGLARSDSYFNMALCLFRHKSTKLSKEYFMKAQELNPADYDSLFGIGLTYEQEGNFPQAASYYQQYLSQNKKASPTVTEARQRLSQIQSKSQQVPKKELKELGSNPLP